MGRRGRTSSAELEVAGKAVSITARPDACYSLRDEEAEVWKAIAESLPADWITPGCAPVLAAYCRATVSARRLGMLIAQEEAAQDYDHVRHLAFIRAHSQVAATVKTLATSLRLTPQSRYTPQRAGTAAGGSSSGRKPWDIDAMEAGD
jgi:hypothetical protein